MKEKGAHWPRANGVPVSNEMSEEQSGFKVTDRRLFNADGTPREIEREETPAQASTPPTTAASQSAASQPQTDASTAASAATQTTAAESAQTATEERAAAASEQEELTDEAYAEEDIPGANDPASFINFLMSIASNAAAALGMMEHPVTGQRGVDLPLGKHWIDVLGMLEEKTRGNLTAQEQQIFTGLLSDLRMQFVSLSRSTQPKRPAGFTASDILGGK